MPEFAWLFIDDYQAFVAQAMGFMSLALYAIAAQMKTSKMMIRISGLGALVFSLHFLMIAAFVPCAVKLIACIRSFTISTDWGRQYRHWIAPTCLAIALAAGFYTAETWWMLICLGGPVAWCTAEFIGEESKMRPLGVVSEGFWLTNNVLVFSLGGIVASLMIMSSFIVSMWRYDGWCNRFMPRAVQA